MSTAPPPPSSSTPTWPADVIHVNEDGWVLINRGRAHGIVAGLRIFVVGAGTRDLHDLFADGSRATGDASDGPVVLRIRRTYELLEIVHVEEHCAVAIAARTPAARRPRFYHGPSGELLVWVPLPEDYSWPPTATAADDDDEAVSGADTADEEDSDAGDAAGDEEQADADTSDVDTPPTHGPQEDDRWEEALPLNGVSVGDIVILAVPAATAEGTDAPAMPAGHTPNPPSPSADAPSNGTWEQSYDWMHPKTE